MLAARFVVLVVVAVLVTAAPASAQQSCKAAPGQGLTLTNVAAHAGRLVAVGSNGLIATSTDGARWRVHRTGVQHDLRGVAWTGSNWIAIGDGGTIVRSLDRNGTRWAPVPDIPSSSLRAIAARPGLIVVGGSSGMILTSTDGGASWRAASSPTTNTLWGGTSEGGKLYLVGKASTVLATSDGVQWRPVPAAPRPTGNPAARRPFLWQIAHGRGGFVAVGDFGAIIRSGASGRLAAADSPTHEILRGIAYGDGRFVVVGSGGVVVTGSGLQRGWREQRSPTPVDLRGVAWTGRRFIAVGDEGTVIASSNGRAWRLLTSAMPCALLGIARDARALVAVGGGGKLLFSRDGRRWQRVPSPTRADLYAVAHGRGGFVAVGTGGTVVRSSDGRHWRLVRSATKLNLHAVFWTGREYLAGGDIGRVISSSDGRRWHAVVFPAFHAVRAFASGAGTVVAAGSGTVATRAAAGRWHLLPIGFEHFWTGVAYGAGRFVIVGHNGTELISADAGRSWVPGTTPTGVNLDAITWTQTQFIATGDAVAIASSDGVSWHAIRTTARHSVRALVTFAGRTIGVGDLGTIVHLG